jgi:hypothetical protein
MCSHWQSFDAKQWVYLIWWKDGQTDGQRPEWTERQVDRKTDGQTAGWTETDRHMQIDRQTGGDK